MSMDNFDQAKMTRPGHTPYILIDKRGAQSSCSCGWHGSAGVSTSRAVAQSWEHVDDVDQRTEDLKKAGRYRLLRDQPRVGLAAGDVLLCVPYWLDDDKLTVLQRERDGFDPECNQYREHVERIEPA